MRCNLRILMGLAVLLGVLLSCRAGDCELADRRGFVSLEFDDSHFLDYSLLFSLRTHHIRASFAVITEESDLGINNGSGGSLQGIYAAGHEIQDHTTRHDYKWATGVDTLDDGIDDYFPYTFATVAEWESLCDRSLFILDSLGIAVTGWNEPGGWGPGNVPGIQAGRGRAASTIRSTIWWGGDMAIWSVVGSMPTRPTLICEGTTPRTDSRYSMSPT